MHIEFVSHFLLVELLVGFIRTIFAFHFDLWTKDTTLIPVRISTSMCKSSPVPCHIGIWLVEWRWHSAVKKSVLRSGDDVESRNAPENLPLDSNNNNYRHLH